MPPITLDPPAVQKFKGFARQEKAPAELIVQSPEAVTNVGIADPLITRNCAPVPAANPETTVPVDA